MSSRIMLQRWSTRSTRSTLYMRKVESRQQGQPTTKAKLDEVLAVHCRADLVTECMKKTLILPGDFAFVFRSKMNVHFRFRFLFGRKGNFISSALSFTAENEQEAQLILTNPRDAFRGQSRSRNIVPFHPYIKYFSSCAIVTLSLRRAVFPIFDFEKCRDLEIRVRGHSGSLKVVPFYRLFVVSY